MIQIKKNPLRQFLDFEQEIKPLYDELVLLDESPDIAANAPRVKQLTHQIIDLRKKVTQDLTNWQKVQLSRHPNRPYTQKYIDLIFDNFSELSGDRNFADDRALIGGFASIDKKTFMVVGQQKGYSTKTRQMHNFGMMYPEGYRKALRLFLLAEKFKKPIVCFIDTPGAFPGIEAENRGQGQAIAQNIIQLLGITVPVICIVIGEGASGGALGIGVGDRIFMMEHTWYTVISPESCSSILWKTWDYKATAADELRLSAKEMLKMKLIDGIIKEPHGGAHWDYEEAAREVKKKILITYQELKKNPTQKLVSRRLKKYRSMGIFSSK